MKRLLGILAIGAVLLSAPPSHATPASQISGDGTYIVGKDISPGTYLSAGDGEYCYWARLSGLSGDFGDIIANGSSAGQQYVRIAPTDVAFETNSCNPWRLAGGAVPQAATPAANSEPTSFTYAMPAGWSPSNTSTLSYGSVLLTNGSATDTSILMGVLDQTLFASAEADNQRAAVRLASDMGEFFMPLKGTRTNQQTIPLASGAASYYQVDFDDQTRPSGQIFAAVRSVDSQRLWAVWLGTTTNPVDLPAAKSLATSMRH